MNSVASSRTHRGSVALMAIMGLVVILVVVLGIMTLANQSFLIGRRQSRLTGVRAIADGGIQYGYWQYAWQGVSVPYSASNVALGTGSFSVTVTDNRANVPYTIKVVSSATMGTEKQVSTRVFADPGIGGPKRIFDFAACFNSDISCLLFKVLIGSATTGGDIYANGNISLNNGGSKVYGNVFCTGSDTVNAMTGLDYAYIKPIAFPDLDTTSYRAIASRVYTSGQTWNGFTFLSPNEVVYVDGNVNLRGSISGTGTLVVNGQLNISNDITYANAAAKIGVLVTQQILIVSSPKIVGFYYVHNVNGNANFNLIGNLTVTSGSIAGDSISVLGLCSITPDTDFTPSLANSLHLPGY